MRISTAFTQQSALSSMLEQQSRLNKTQLQIASGKKIQSAADDPSAAASSLVLKQALATTQQYQKNAGQARDRLSQEEDTLGRVNQVLDRVRELTIQGNNATLNAADRQMLVAEMKQRFDEVLAYANAKDANGEYLFAGYQSHTQPFSQTSSVGAQYNGDDGQRYVQIASDRQLAITDPGSAVFRGLAQGNGRFVTAGDTGNTGSGMITVGRVADARSYHGESYVLVFTAKDTYELRDSVGTVVQRAAYKPGMDVSFSGIQFGLSGAPASGDSFTVSPSGKQDVFSVLSTVINALSDGNDSSAARAGRASVLGRSIIDMDQAQENARKIQADVGARLNAIDAQIGANDGQALQLETTLSSLNDLDYASAVTQLNLYMVGLQAAQQSYTRIQGLSLFNFL